jgi:hypothetical protein
LETFAGRHKKSRLATQKSDVEVIDLSFFATSDASLSVNFSYKADIFPRDYGEQNPIKII